MEAAFEALVREQQGRIWAVARRFAGGEEQKDLYQEILVQLWRGFAGFRGESSPATWVYRVALNTALMNKRQSRRRADTVSMDVVPEAAEPGGACQAALLEQFLTAQNEIDRALLLMYLDDLSGTQMAEVLGLSVGAVQVRINRLKKGVQRALCGGVTMNLDDMKTTYKEDCKMQTIMTDFDAVKARIQALDERVTARMRLELMGAAVIVLSGVWALSAYSHFPLMVRAFLLAYTLIGVFYAVVVMRREKQAPPEDWTLKGRLDFQIKKLEGDIRLYGPLINSGIVACGILIGAAAYAANVVLRDTWVPGLWVCLAWVATTLFYAPMIYLNYRTIRQTLRPELQSLQHLRAQLLEK